MSEWQPIETAPPADWTTDVDLWVEHPNGPGAGERITGCRASMTNGKPDWHQPCDEYGWRRIHGNPTHWMPVPEPPSEGRLS